MSDETDDILDEDDRTATVVLTMGAQLPSSGRKGQLVKPAQRGDVFKGSYDTCAALVGAKRAIFAEGGPEGLNKPAEADALRKEAAAAKKAAAAAAKEDEKAGV